MAGCYGATSRGANAIFRDAPSLFESDPTGLGPLVETLVQSSIRDYNLQVHFYRDFEQPNDRNSPVREVDFVAERTDGATLPIEVKFRKRIDEEDLLGLRSGSAAGPAGTRRASWVLRA